MSSHQYVPGVCNIGKAETRARWIAGWVGVVGTVALIFACWHFKVEPKWRLVAFLPATLAAIGFLQAAMYFCVGFGFQGVFNFGENVGATDTVEQAEFRSKDRNTAIRILLISVVIGAAIAAGAYFLPG